MARNTPHPVKSVHRETESALVARAYGPQAAKHLACASLGPGKQAPPPRLPCSTASQIAGHALYTRGFVQNPIRQPAGLTGPAKAHVVIPRGTTLLRSIR